MRYSVIGPGRWGTFISWYLSQKEKVYLYGRSDSQKYKELEINRKNEYVSINDNIILTSDIEKALSSKIILISISSQNLRNLIKQIIQYDIKDKIFILCMKGIEAETGKRLTEILIEEGIDKNKIAIWVGPGHIQAFTEGKPNCMLIDGYNKELVKTLADSMRSDLIRFYYGDDIIGSEIGAAAKNVMGIAAGMLDGGGYETLKGTLMARGAREVSRLIKKMGGNELSAYGLCHLGDYETTLFSKYSNNRKFGEMFVLKEPFTKLAEGVSTAKAMKLLGEKYGEELPITNAVYSIINENKDPMKVFLTLFSRSARKEF